MSCWLLVNTQNVRVSREKVLGLLCLAGGPGRSHCMHWELSVTVRGVVCGVSAAGPQAQWCGLPLHVPSVNTHSGVHILEIRRII